MQAIASRVTDYFLEKEIIAREQAEWCRYMLERRLVTGVSLVVLVTVGALLAGLPQALVLNFGVGFLRGRTNGYHAKTLGGCLVRSLACEIVCLTLYPFLKWPAAAALLLAASGVIFGLAPVNNENVHFSESEMAALRRSARVRLVLADMLAAVLLWGAPTLAGCFVLAIVAVAVFLIAAKAGLGVQ